jgi:DNA repair protein RadA
VKSQGARKSEAPAEAPAAASELSGLEGVGPKTVDALVKAGITEIAALAALTPAELVERAGLGEKTAAKIVAAAKAVAPAAAPAPSEQA